MNKNILVIAPHADDEVLGCGASIAKHGYEGDNVSVLVMTNASIGAPELFNKQSIKIVRNEAMLAHKILKVKNTYFLNFPAPKLNTFPTYKISIEINKYINSIKPDVVYLPHPGDLHLDHYFVYRSALVSLRPQIEIKVPLILCYETLSETEWAPHQGNNSFIPNYFIDVTEYFNLKKEAMLCYSSQIRKFPHSRSIKALESLSNYRGATVSVKNAEAFEVERIIVY